MIKMPKNKGSTKRGRPNVGWADSRKEATGRSAGAGQGPMATTHSPGHQEEVTSGHVTTTGQDAKATEPQDRHGHHVNASPRAVNGGHMGGCAYRQ